ncbi:MAG: methyltransferase domain-containing protein [Methanobacteriota archaeon]|nr:MAG: methyltransferase domain-containing protein [Euryarchaeota archaeon]
MRYREEHIDDILSLLYPQLGKPLLECTVLDLGCGLGALSLPASRRVKSVKGIDLDQSYIARCRERVEREGITNATFEVKSLFDLDGHEQYDIVLCSDVLEHVEDQDGLMEKIIISLGDGGVFYLTTNNKYWPMEGHFGMLFLSYLPRNKAEEEVKRAGKGKIYNVYPLSYNMIKRLLSKYPIDFEFKPPKKPHKMMYRLGAHLISISPFFWNFSNAFQIVGKKRSSLES